MIQRIRIRNTGKLNKQLYSVGRRRGAGVLEISTCDTLRLIKIKTRVADPDPDSIGSVDPDLESGFGSGSRRAKITHKSRNFF
jgi:hypothetical protein